MTKITEVYFTYFKFSYNGVVYETQGSAADVGKAMLDAAAHSKHRETLPEIVEINPNINEIDQILPEELQHIAANRGLAFFAVQIGLTNYNALGVK